MIKLVIFDVWNTLLDLRKLYKILSANLATLARISQDEAYELLSKTAARIRLERRRGVFISVEDSLKLFEEETGINEEVLKKALSTTFNEARNIRIPGALETLKALREMGYEIAVLGNTIYWQGALTRLLLAREGLYEYIDRSFFSDEIKASKPDPKAFMAVINAFKVDEEEALHVGDRADEDFAGALIAGLNAALITRGVEKIIRIHRRGFVVPSITSIPEVTKLLDKGSRLEARGSRHP
ncbi:MAG: HAD family hydrolase [Pyrodictiaceae archaeon]